MTFSRELPIAVRLLEGRLRMFGLDAQHNEVVIRHSVLVPLARRIRTQTSKYGISWNVCGHLRMSVSYDGCKYAPWGRTR